MGYRAITQSLFLRKCYISTTRAEVNTYTVVFFSKYIDFPAVKIDDFLTQAAENIIKVLKNPPAPIVPSFEAGYETNNSILKLALIFDRMDGTNKK